MKTLRLWRYYIITSFGLFGIIGSAASAPFSLGNIEIAPRIVPPKTSVTVKVTMKITDATLIPGSAFLYRADLNGKPVTQVGTFRDDGAGGDLIAGDSILTAHFIVSELQAMSIPLVATAAFKGELLRTYSNLNMVEVAADADLSLPKGLVQGDRIIFLNSSGSVIRTIPIITLKDTTSGATITRLTEQVILSRDQSHAGVISSQSVAPTQSDEVLEFLSDGDTFKNYTGQNGLTWQLAAPDGKQFFLPKNGKIYSAKGDRVALITTEDQGSQADLAVYSNTGSKLYQLPETFTAVIDAALSEDGEYLGSIVVRTTGDDGVYIFRVDAVNSGQAWEYPFDPTILETYFFVQSLQGFTLILNNTPAVSLP